MEDEIKVIDGEEVEVLVTNTEEGDKVEEPRLLDVRQKLTWDYYFMPRSKTYGNAFRSAIRAGYSYDYSRVITLKPWFKKRLRRMNLLNKAEKVLDKTLNISTLNKEGIEDAALLRVQNDTAKFVAKTLGKDDGYTERNEVTGKDGQGIVFMPMELMEKYGLKDGSEETLLEDNQEL